VAPARLGDALGAVALARGVALVPGGPVLLPRAGEPHRRRRRARVLTDGGHLENTGAYELLRRRCKVIIASDAEEDRFVRFGGLAALVRYARLDLHTRVDLDLGDLRRAASDLSRRHAALGTITYPALADGTPAEYGYFLYLKSSITGDEDELIREYRPRFGDFPHQSTANQLFDEDQFEAYRALGEHAMEGLFTRDFEVDPRVGATGQWVDDLAVRLRPDASGDPSFAELRDELEEVETLLRAPGAGAYFAELYPALAAGGHELAAEPERLFALVTRQIHWMATVFNRLGLDVPDAHRFARHQRVDERAVPLGRGADLPPLLAGAGARRARGVPAVLR
jgi:hypothetical protein